MPRSARLQAAFGVIVTVLALLALLHTAACGASQRQKTLRATFATVNAACDGLEAWDRTRQEQIVAAADPTKVTKEFVRAQLDAHRAEMDKVYGACTVAYRLIAAASMSDDGRSLQTATEEAHKVIDAVKQLKGDL